MERQAPYLPEGPRTMTTGINGDDKDPTLVVLEDLATLYQHFGERAGAIATSGAQARPKLSAFFIGMEYGLKVSAWFARSQQGQKRELTNVDEFHRFLKVIGQGFLDQLNTLYNMYLAEDIMEQPDLKKVTGQ